ncbi:protein FAM222B-like [Gouania willdenowi]|uniref:Protein FAM222B-like n=1 Tax=Gouania willdenowi TaxID=441366 RepID=A0A8C5HMZ8_GOUWI|nr:protein FAM222B-like [Gouania willdenowi]XP_028320601.1 protein FAM222B-like [Gouania willdenowi]
MLACLPVSNYTTSCFLSLTQMNTGLQKWETTQKMRSASCPTPAQLDAFAKKVANNPLSIQIFPNSIKVPQRKHIRRTVNGLDTSSSAQRHSPYLSQVSAGAGLLAVLRPLTKGYVKELDGSRTRQTFRAAMNPHGGSYAAHSTLNVAQAPPTLSHLQQRNATHPQTLQHRLAPPPPQGVQRQHSAPHPQGVVQHLQHPTLKHPTAPSTLLPQQVVTQDLLHLSDRVQLPVRPHAQPPPPQVVSGGLQQAPPTSYGSRKLPDADAPPNVTVSTSTIPLSMAASLQQNRGSDLSSIVLQINQLCQARAGGGATSVCEGQIANPSPISRNLLINASSRVSLHHPGMGGASSCLMVAPPPDKLQTLGGVPALHDHEKVHQQQQLQRHLQQQKQLQHLQLQQRSWAQHQMAHMQQPPDDPPHPCKNPRMEPPPSECTYPPRNLGYTHKLPSTAQSFSLKHPCEKAPVASPANAMPYVSSHYITQQQQAPPPPPWNNNRNHTGAPQELPVTFQAAAAKYRPGKDANVAQAKLMQSVDFLGAEFHVPGFQEQCMDAMKMHRAAMEPGNSSGVLSHHHQGYH